ncbi:MAG TPA: hypothetical protein VIO32_09800 [Candidatus Baltobacteraceae bacterium]
MTLAEVDLEIERLQPHARAESAFAALARNAKNPWAGSLNRLAAMESQREKLLLAAEGERLLRALDDLAAAEADIDRRSLERAAAEAAFKETERHPIVARWRDAQRLANKHEVGHGFNTWAKAFVSACTPAQLTDVAMRNGCARWPEALRFTDADRKVVQGWSQAKTSATAASVMEGSARARREEILRAHPELRGITIPPAKAPAAKAA